MTKIIKFIPKRIKVRNSLASMANYLAKTNDSPELQAKLTKMVEAMDKNTRKSCS